MAIPDPNVNFDKSEDADIPSTYVPYVRRLRDFLDDTVAQNDLEGVEESSD